MKFEFSLVTLLMLAGVTAAPAQTIALKNVHVIDVNALKVTENQTVVIEDDKIKAVLDANDSKELSGNNVQIIDMAGKYLLPGLIDTHVHHATSPDDSDNDQVTRMRLRKLLRGGVTTVRDMGGDTRALGSLKRRADNDVIQSPDIYYSVIIGGQEFFSDPRTVASAKGQTPGQVDWMRAVNAQTNFDEVMLRTIGTGATGIKIYARVGSKLIPKLAESAKRHSLKVWSHAFVGPARPDDAVTGGVETISHAPDFSAQVIQNFYEQRRKGEQITEQQQTESFELERYDHLIADMLKNDTILDATLTVFEARKDQSDRGALMYNWGTTFTRLAHEKGIRISTGTDATSDYLKKDYPLVHHEMQLLVDEVGFTPFEAIQSATFIGAQVIGIEETHGSVEPGKVANLLIVNNDPTKDIKNLLSAEHVIKNGQFVHLGDMSDLPFSSARKAGGLLWLSGQIGNFPSTKTLVGGGIKEQMTQAMKNIGVVLEEHNIHYRDIVKCTVMLKDMSDWAAANEVYRSFFEGRADELPARSSFAASGLALDAKAEVECVAEF